MTRGVGDDEFPLGGGKVAVGDVDGDALFPLGLETVGQQGEVDVFVAAATGGLLHGFELVLENGFGIVEQSPDEGGFTVIDGAGGGEAEQIHG